ncbi:MAG: branched-chain amino acid ABC transporter permease [Candidatus Methylumidiphilus sp.]
MDYIFHIVTLLGIYAILAVSLDILVGESGLLSIAHGAFASLGAYATAIITVKIGWPALSAILVGMIVSGILSLGLAFASLRVRGDYFAVSTFGFHVIVYRILDNWVPVTGGPMGIPGVPPIFSEPGLDQNVVMALTTTLLAGASWLTVDRVRRSPFGRALRIARDDDIFAESIGKSVLLLRCQAVSLGGALAALAGSLYAHHLSYVDASAFTVMESILVLAMVAVGGAGSRFGPLLGACLLVLLPEVLRFVGFPSSIAAILRQFMFGIFLVLVVLWRPQGLLGAHGVLR